MSVRVYFAKWACLDNRKSAPTILRLETPLTKHLLLLVPNWLSSGISMWECTAGRLNCNQIFTCSNRSICPSQNQLLLPQASLGCDKWLSLPSLLQHKKSEHCEHHWWTETSLIVTNACFLRNTYGPKSHTHPQKKWEVDRIKDLCANRLLGCRGGLHGPSQKMAYVIFSVWRCPPSIMLNRSDASFPSIPLMLELKKDCNNLFMAC